MSNNLKLQLTQKDNKYHTLFKRTQMVKLHTLLSNLLLLLKETPSPMLLKLFLMVKQSNTPMKSNTTLKVDQLPT
jgi:hypothetical protein